MFKRKHLANKGPCFATTRALPGRRTEQLSRRWRGDFKSKKSRRDSGRRGRRRAARACDAATPRPSLPSIVAVCRRCPRSSWAGFRAGCSCRCAPARSRRTCCPRWCARSMLPPTLLRPAEAEAEPPAIDRCAYTAGLVREVLTRGFARRPTRTTRTATSGCTATQMWRLRRPRATRPAR